MKIKAKVSVLYEFEMEVEDNLKEWQIEDAIEEKWNREQQFLEDSKYEETEYDYREI